MAETFGALCAELAGAHGARTAVKFQDRETSFAEVDRRASRVANALIASGCAPGARVALLAKNDDTFLEIALGACRAGVVVVPVNWRLVPPEIRFIVDDAMAELLLVGEEYIDTVEGIRGELPRLRQVITVTGRREGWPAYEEWRDSQPASPPDVAVDAGDVCFQMYTSGTTGLPKGAQITHENLLVGLLGEKGDEWGRWTLDDISLVVMPLFHIAGSGMLLLGYCRGVTSVIMPEVDPGAIIAAIQSEGVTKVLFVPAVVLFLLQHPDCAKADFSSLDYIYYGASPMPVEVLKSALATFGCKFIQLYGATETTGAITYLAPEEHDTARPERLLSCGRAMTGNEIVVVDEDGQPLPPRQVGEIICRSRQVMRGYWNQPEATERSIRDGWFYTGDAGYLDEEGFLYIYDRVKDMIISGAENIYPTEVENALFEHRGVADVAAIGVPDDTWGEVVKAVVVRKPGSEVSAEELIDHARERIAGFKVPKSVDFVEALPRNPSGKILKRALREPYWQGRARRVN